MLSKTSGAREPEEEAPLLPDGHPHRKETPLPITQVLVLLLLLLSEPLTSISIRPYINQACPSIIIKSVTNRNEHISL
jgi:hypothetical protein